jgi:hypothetical protein
MLPWLTSFLVLIGCAIFIEGIVRWTDNFSPGQANLLYIVTGLLISFDMALIATLSRMKFGQGRIGRWIIERLQELAVVGAALAASALLAGGQHTLHFTLIFGGATAFSGWAIGAFITFRRRKGEALHKRFEEVIDDLRALRMRVENLDTEVQQLQVWAKRDADRAARLSSRLNLAAVSVGELSQRAEASERIIRAAAEQEVLGSPDDAPTPNSA